MELQKVCAFLRAINVGGRTVKMDALKEYFASLGFEGVQTYIQSGNVIFEAAFDSRNELEKQIGAHLAEKLGYAVPVMIRSGPELSMLLERYPFEDEKTADHVVYVSFLEHEPDPDLVPAVVELADGVMQFAVIGKDVFWLRDKSKGQSKITNGTIEKTLNLSATRRNLNTVQKIYKKYFS